MDLVKNPLMLLRQDTLNDLKQKSAEDNEGDFAFLSKRPALPSSMLLSVDSSEDYAGDYGKPIERVPNPSLGAKPQKPARIPKKLEDSILTQFPKLAKLI